MLTVDALSKFSYDVLDAGGTLCATVRMPTRPAMARNSAFRIGPNGHVAIDAGGDSFRVEYETFNPRTIAPPDYRFFLMRGDATVATCTQQPGRPRSWRLQAEGVDCRLLQARRAWSLDFEVRDVRGNTGRIRETTRFLALRRRFEIVVPFLPDVALQAFLFFIAVNATYR